MTITTQPSVNSLNAAYKPIIFEVNVEDTCPLMYCDIYINGNYYKSISKTQPVSKITGFFFYQFDIEDSPQELLTKYLPQNGGSFFYEHTNGMCKIKCKFRSTFINGDGFLDSTYTAPIQATDDNPATSGTGETSNEFYVVNSTIQQDELQVLTQHLNSYKRGTWNAEVYPLTHRLPSCDIKLIQSDFFPILHLAELGVMCIRLNYKYRDAAYTTINSCDVAEPSIVIEFQWNRTINDFVDFTGRINGTYTYIDWGDGVTNTSISHTYITTGNYTVRIYNSTSTILLLNTDNTENLDIQLVNLYTPYPLHTLEIVKNNITTILLTNQLNLESFIATDNNMTSVGTVPALVTNFVANINAFNTAAVNQILIDLDTNGLLNGNIDIRTQTGIVPPTGAGATAKSNLISKGWTVLTD